MSDDAPVIEAGRIAHACAKQLLPSEAAADVAQDVALVALLKQRAHELPTDPSGFALFIRKITTRRAIDWLRRHRAQRKLNAEASRVLGAVQHEWMRSDASVDERDARETVDRALRAMPALTRRAYLMVRCNHQSYEEVGAELRISRASVGRHVRRARSRMNAALAPICRERPRHRRELHREVAAPNIDRGRPPVKREAAAIIGAALQGGV